MSATAPVQNNSLGSSHYIVAKIVGIVCVHPNCNCIINKRNPGLWPPSRDLLRRHLKEKECFVGNLPNTRDLTKQLINSQKSLHLQAKRNPQLAQMYFDEIFPSNSTSIPAADICTRCGFWTNKNYDINRHFGKGNQLCNISSKSKGRVLVGKFGISCPTEIIKQICDGFFDLPYSHEEQHAHAPTLTSLNETIARKCIMKLYFINSTINLKSFLMFT